jgi:hypothetical protein
VVALATVGAWWGSADGVPGGAIVVTVEGAAADSATDSATESATDAAGDAPDDPSAESTADAAADPAKGPDSVAGSAGGTTQAGGGHSAADRPEGRVPCADPPRILGIGDSIAAQAVGPAIELLAGAGYATALDARWGTGPLDADPDWLALAREHAVAFDPDLVLVLFYGNYWQPRFDEQGREIIADTPEQYRLWAERARLITEVFTDRGARVVWIAPPPRPGSRFSPDTVSGTWPATLAVVGSIPGVSVASSGALLADADGRWTSTIVGNDGQEHAVRSEDGVHLVPYSGDLMAIDIAAAAIELLAGDPSCRSVSPT